MKRIMLVCAAGMSTSLLVTKMEQAAKAAGDEVEIFALPISDGEKKLADVDCVLLGPQVRFQRKQIDKLIADQGLDLPVDVIDMKDYGMMNGKAVYEFALKLMNK
jgi:PTS system cellobiose-specific IIB component